MKLLRLSLLVLLAVLLPVRGAMAAAMLCQPAAAGGHGELRLTGHPAGHVHAGGEQEPAAQAEPVPHDHEGAAGGHGKSSHDKCNVCSACCSSPTLPSASTGIDEPLPASAAFPDPPAPAPTFLSGGQERPPRTL